MNNEYVNTAPTRAELKLAELGIFLLSKNAYKTSQESDVLTIYYQYCRSPIYRVTVEDDMIFARKIADNSEDDMLIRFDSVQGIRIKQARNDFIWLDPKEVEAIHERASELLCIHDEYVPQKEEANVQEMVEDVTNEIIPEPNTEEFQGRFLPRDHLGANALIISYEKETGINLEERPNEWLSAWYSCLEGIILSLGNDQKRIDEHRNRETALFQYIQSNTWRDIADDITSPNGSPSAKVRFMTFLNSDIAIRFSVWEEVKRRIDQLDEKVKRFSKH